MKKSHIQKNIKELLVAGNSSREIIEKIKKDMGFKIAVHQLTQMINQGRAELKNEYTTLPDEVKAIHAARYRTMIHGLRMIEEIPFEHIGTLRKDGTMVIWKDWFLSRQAFIQARFDLLETMKNLEDLLGLHEKSFVIDISENIQVTHKQEQQYDISRISLDEKVRYLDLLRKCRTDKDELTSVTERTFTEDSEVKVIAGDEVPNIEQIKLIQAPRAVHPEQKFFDPAAKLRETMKRMAAKEFTKITHNLDDEEKRLLTGVPE